jgi:hypothetical protein
MNDLAVPQSLADLPALIESAMRHLAEARTIEDVRKVHDFAQLAAAYAKKHKAAVEAQNECTLVVVFAERRIAEEIDKERKKPDGILARHGAEPGTNRAALCKGGSSALTRRPVDAVGIPKWAAKEYAKLRVLSADQLREIADEGSRQGKPVPRSRFLRVAKSLTKPEPIPEVKTKRRKRRQGLHLVPTTDSQGRRLELTQFAFWLDQGREVIAAVRSEPYDLADEARRGNLYINPRLARSVAKFLVSFAEATEAVRAA